MYSTYSMSQDIFTINLNLKDFDDEAFTLHLLEIVNKSKLSKLICNLSSVDVISQNNIKQIETLVQLLQFNNIQTIVCGVNAYSASVLFHFLDNFNFKTALNIQRAIDDFQNS